MNTQGTTSNNIVLGVMGLMAVIFLGVFGLVALGRDIGQVVYFIGPTLVLLGGILAALLKVNGIAKETQEQTTKIDGIAHAVNGQLDAKFKAIHEKIDGLSNQIGLASLEEGTNNEQ